MLAPQPSARMPCAPYPLYPYYNLPPLPLPQQPSPAARWGRGLRAAYVSSLCRFAPVSPRACLCTHSCARMHARTHARTPQRKQQTNTTPPGRAPHTSAAHRRAPPTHKHAGMQSQRLSALPVTHMGVRRPPQHETKPLSPHTHKRTISCTHVYTHKPHAPSRQRRARGHAPCALAPPALLRFYTPSVRQQCLTLS